MKKLFITILTAMLTFTAASTFAYADEITICPEESPAATIAAAQAVVNIKTIKPELKASYINTGLTCGKTYYYKLRAYQVKSGKKVYSKYSDVKSTYPKPSKAKNVKVKFTVGGVSTFDLDWDKVSGASGYQLQFKAGRNEKNRLNLS